MGRETRKEMLEIFQAKWKANRLRIEQENAQLEPWPCDCGRGVVTTIFGCDLCAKDAANEFEAWLMGLKIHKGRLIE